MPALTMPLSSELRCLAAIRQAQADFFDDVLNFVEKAMSLSEAGDLTREERKMLQSDGVSQIAEFFFVLAESGTTSADAIRGLLMRHNSDMAHMIAGCVRGYTRFGLAQARLKQALFSEHQIELIVHESAHAAVTFDQRSIGKLLTQVMSFESCRSTLVLLAKGGLLVRRDFRSVVLISSNGALENLYKKHLSLIVGAIQD